MKKKLVSILLCAALAVTAFTGCGSSDPEEEAKSKAENNGSRGCLYIRYWGRHR